jgi:hypothetical protein
MNNTTSESYDASTQVNYTWPMLLPIPIFLFLVAALMLQFVGEKQRLRLLAAEQHRQRLLAAAQQRLRLLAAIRAVREANPLTELSLKQRKEVYKRAFISNGNCITLTDNNLSESENKEIKMDSRSSCEFVDIELGSDEITSKSMHLVFEKRYNTEGNQRRTNGSACKKQKQRKHIVTTNDISCIICFEDFSVDDTIVWSENNECPHFYHRKCMIDYLASKRQKKKIITDNTDQSNDHSDDNADDISGTERTIDDDDDEHNTIIEDNPCPTCRRNFCSITVEDLNFIH